AAPDPYRARHGLRARGTRRLMRPPSITLRIALMFAAASGLILFAAGLWISSMVVRHFEEQDLVEIRGKLELVRNLVETKATPADFDRLPTELARALVGHHELGIVLLDSGGDILFASLGERLAETLRSHPLPGNVPTEFKDSERGYRGMGMRLDSGMPAVGELRVGVLLDITHHEHFLADLRRTLWLAIGVVAVGMGVLGWFVARSGLLPIRRLTHRITAVAPTRLAERVPQDDVAPELQQLAQAFNAMLQRLEDGYRRLSEFSSDIAHELRTPLANLRTQAEVTLGKDRSEAEYRDLLHSTLEEVDRLSRMVDDMLLLAKADDGRLPGEPGPVALHREVDALIDFFEALAEDRGIRLRRSGEASLSGHGPMLRRALANLVANAVRHADPDSVVSIDLATSTAGGITVEVTNRGADIPATALPRLFDRFYRADPSRQRSSEGAGLGLAIAQAIVRVHGGDIRATSAAGTTRFTCQFDPQPSQRTD
ncbi:MAG: heavy metal sensor histidine kinase, partial [Rhodocyclaceae bacterium]|nr:heavy metal sensor histidine kinase [Rhodocyclaceae bacterium]